MKREEFDKQICGSDSGLWNVDHIMPPKDFISSTNEKPIKYSLVRLVHYHNDIEKDSGVRYILVDPKLEKPKYNNIIDFGNALYIDNRFLITERKEIAFNNKKWNMPILTPDNIVLIDINPEIRNRLMDHMRDSMSDSADAGEYSDPNAVPVQAKRKDAKNIWAKIYVHNIGQGDTIVLELPNNQLWMIDARFWQNSRRDEFDRWFKRKFRNRKLNRLIVSHFHYDHIRSIPYILQKYDPDQVVITDSLIHTTATANKVMHLTGKKLYRLPYEEITTLGKLKIQLHRTDEFIRQGGSKNPNDHEVSVSLRVGNNYAFLAGDIPGKMCNDLVNTDFFSGLSDNSKLYYKVSHHCSLTGYHQPFFNNYRANHSVTSCGLGNRYGFPHDPPDGLFIGRHEITCSDSKKRVYKYCLEE